MSPGATVGPDSLRLSGAATATKKCDRPRRPLYGGERKLLTLADHNNQADRDEHAAMA
jgi:hypothetical protein